MAAVDTEDAMEGEEAVVAVVSLSFYLVFLCSLLINISAFYYYDRRWSRWPRHQL